MFFYWFVTFNKENKYIIVYLHIVLAGVQRRRMYSTKYVTSAFHSQNNK